VPEIAQLIVRDIVEAPWLLVVIGLPLVLGGVAARAGSRLGWVAVGLITAMLFAYLAYYAIPLPNPGAARAALIAMSVAVLASATAAVGYLRGSAKANSSV
jgi:hypothetical protein